MSGSIGADRIKRSAVQDTVDSYVENVLSGFSGFKSAKITGSYNAGTKKRDFGDIDLSVCIDGGDKDLRTVKKELAAYIESLSDDVTVPFKAGKHAGKKVQIYGNVVTCQVPIEGFSGMTVQIDNMVVLSEKEQEYQKNFLDLDAAKQGLIMGLVRVILQEENPEQAFKRLGIKKLPELEKNQELEFVLSANGLSLRKVTLGDDYKEVSREEIWRSADWQDVVKLLQSYDLSKDFDHLLGDIKDRVTSARSRRRIIGIMKSMINVSSGEKGTPKGDAKERAINAAESSLGTLDEVAEGDAKGVIGLYGGGFKPPHKGHYEVLKKLLSRTDKVIIFIGSGNRDGIPINQEQSKKIWEIYVDASGWSNRVEIRTVNSPVTEIYHIIENPDLQDYQYRIARTAEGAEEDKKWKYFLKNQDKFPNVKLVTIPVTVDQDGDKLSASDLRKSEEKIKKGKWIPTNVLSAEDVAKVIDIALEQVQVEIVKENLKLGIVKTMNEIRGKKSIEENISGISVSPRSVISSDKRAKLADLFYKLQDEIGDQFNVKFNQSNILILPLYPSDTPMDIPTYRNDRDIYEGQEEKKPFDYAKNIASLIGFMEKEGVNLHPLPEIIFDKGDYDDNSLLAKTGDYNSTDKIIRVYGADDRHPIDLLRSTAHELYHHHQNLNGEVGEVKGQKTSEDSSLEKLEAEAYEKGNILYRKWLESIGKYE